MRRLALLAWCALTVTAHAQSIRLLAPDGSLVQAGEVCRWKAGAPSNAITRFFSFSDVTCDPLPARIPPGEWNVFARRGDDLVSEVSIFVSSAALPKELVFRLIPAKHAGPIALRKDEHAFVYVPRSASVYPADTIPVQWTGIPIIVAGGIPVRLAMTPPREGRADVLIPIRFASIPAGKVAPPQVKANGELASDSSTPRAGGVALAIVRDVRGGAISIDLLGERWHSAHAEIKAPANGQLAIAGAPLVANATSHLSVHWWSPVDLTSLAQPARDCAGTKKESHTIKFAAAILTCPDQKATLDIDTVNRDTCTVDAEHSLPVDRDGTVDFNDVTSGLHYLRFTCSGLPDFFQSIDVKPDESVRVETALHYQSFTGRVTRGGKPVMAELFDTVSDTDTGEYAAVLRRSPGGPITIEGCDPKWEYLLVPDHLPEDNGRFDIDVPVNQVKVTVVDSHTGKPIEKARVTFAALIPGEKDAAHFAGYGGLTDPEGTYVITPLLTNRVLHVCATHDSHDSACADPFTIEIDEKKQFLLALDPLTKREGRVITNGSMSWGEIAWWSADGHLTEIARFSDPAGNFTYKKPHAEGEIVAFIAPGQPLYAFRQRHVEDGEKFVITVPALRHRRFTVSLSSTSTERVAFVTIRLGDLTVPLNALDWHQMSNDFQSALRPGWSTIVPDVLETGPIRVILIPGSVIERHPDAEMPFIPEAGSLPQQELGDRDAITF